MSALCLGVLLLAFLFIHGQLNSSLTLCTGFFLNYTATQGTIEEDHPRRAVFTAAVMDSANWKELFPFVKSLRETGYKGDVIIWTENRRIL